MKDQKIFISSTFSDLIEYRESVQKAIRKTGAIDISMENFGSRDNRPLEECLRIIKEETDLFVGIYAHRYGFIPDKYDISITEMEYNEAIKCDIPVLVFVIDEDEPWSKKFIDFGENETKLLTFKSRLGKQKMWTRFTNKDNLASSVVSSLIREIDYQGIKSIDKVEQSEINTSDDWSNHRNNIYANNDGIFLTHILSKSTSPNQEFDIFIYLIKHKQKEINIKKVAFVEFYFGRQWKDKIFKVENEGGYIGINLSAYGEFLCICRITFKDGSKLHLDRYIDFESMKK